MNAHKVQTYINQQGQLVLNDLPFNPGEKVEVIILGYSTTQFEENYYPLQGTVLNYDEPFEPAIML